MLLRTLAGFLLFAHLGGVLWFADTLPPLWWAYAVLMSTSLAFVTLVREPRQGKLRAVGPPLLLVTGVVTGFVVAQDVQLSGRPDIGAIALRLTALTVIACILFRSNSAGRNAHAKG